MAALAGHALRFHERSDVDGSGKADARATGRPADRVWGVVARLSPSDKEELDRELVTGRRRVDIAARRSRAGPVDLRPRPPSTFPGDVLVAGCQIGPPAETGRDPMSPASGGRPIPPRLLNQLASTLRAVEGARRSRDDREGSVATALEDLAALGELVEGVDEGSLPEDVDRRLDEARAALEADDVDGARDILIGVGRAIDEYLRG